MMDSDVFWKHIGGEGGETRASSLILEAFVRQRGDSGHWPAWLIHFKLPRTEYKLRLQSWNHTDLV